MFTKLANQHQKSLYVSEKLHFLCAVRKWCTFITMEMFHILHGSKYCYYQLIKPIIFLINFQKLKSDAEGKKTLTNCLSCSTNILKCKIYDIYCHRRGLKNNFKCISDFLLCISYLFLSICIYIYLKNSKPPFKSACL